MGLGEDGKMIAFTTISSRPAGGMLVKRGTLQSHLHPAKAEEKRSPLKKVAHPFFCFASDISDTS